MNLKIQNPLKLSFNRKSKKQDGQKPAQTQSRNLASKALPDNATMEKYLTDDYMFKLRKNTGRVRGWLEEVSGAEVAASGSVEQYIKDNEYGPGRYSISVISQINAEEPQKVYQVTIGGKVGDTSVDDEAMAIVGLGPNTEGALIRTLNATQEQLKVLADRVDEVASGKGKAESSALVDIMTPFIQAMAQKALAEPEIESGNPIENFTGMLSALTEAQRVMQTNTPTPPYYTPEQSGGTFNPNLPAHQQPAGGAGSFWSELKDFLSPVLSGVVGAMQGGGNMANSVVSTMGEQAQAQMGPQTPVTVDLATGQPIANATLQGQPTQPLPQQGSRDATLGVSTQRDTGGELKKVIWTKVFGGFATAIAQKRDAEEVADLILDGALIAERLDLGEIPEFRLLITNPVQAFEKLATQMYEISPDYREAIAREIKKGLEEEEDFELSRDAMPGVSRTEEVEIEEDIQPQEEVEFVSPDDIRPVETETEVPPEEETLLEAASEVLPTIELAEEQTAEPEKGNPEGN